MIGHQSEHRTRILHLIAMHPGLPDGPSVQRRLPARPPHRLNRMTALSSRRASSTWTPSNLLERSTSIPRGKLAAGDRRDFRYCRECGVELLARSATCATL